MKSNSQNEESLPESWTIARLEQICTPPQYGWTTSADKNGSGLKLLRTTDISTGIVNWSTVPCCKKEPDNPEKYLLSPGDLVVSRAGSVGLSYLVKECPKAIFASYLIRFQAVPPMESEFISLYLKSPEYWTTIADETAGIAIPNVNASKLKRLEVPLPPLAEQKRIVAKVEQLLVRVNAAWDRLAKVPEILKRFRQSVLAAACSGKLTADWREEQSNVRHAKVLLSSILAERRQSQKGSHVRRRNAFNSRHGYQESPGIDSSDLGELPDGWVWASGENLFAWSSGKFLPKKKQQKGSYPIYGGNGITGYHSNYLVGHSTLVIGRVGALCGNVYITSGKAWVTDNAIYATYVPTKLNLLYVHMAFIQANLNANSGGSGQPFVNQTVLNEVGVPLPPLSEQHEIVRRVEALFKVSDIIENRVAVATAHAEKLTQAILSKAFRGDLVPTEAELARGEGRSYEPASVLLERIKAEREVLEKEKSLKKRTESRRRKHKTAAKATVKIRDIVDQVE